MLFCFVYVSAQAGRLCSVYRRSSKAAGPKQWQVAMLLSERRLKVATWIYRRDDPESWTKQPARHYYDAAGLFVSRKHKRRPGIDAVPE